MTDLKENDSMRSSATSGRSVAVTRIWLVTLISIGVVLADQILKFWVKTNFYLGEDLPITGWWHLKFIENNGMAFGLELWNKLVLSLGRIAAVALFIWFVSRVYKSENLRTGFFVAVAMIIAGAAGNIFDCVFYGKIFNNPMPPEVASLFPADGGYAGWFEGKVVDMLYFPLFSFRWPDWFPLVGGQYYEFFQYIFNIADASICIGVALLIFFYSSDASKAFAEIGERSRQKEIGRTHGKTK